MSFPLPGLLNMTYKALHNPDHSLQGQLEDFSYLILCTPHPIPQMYLDMSLASMYFSCYFFYQNVLPTSFTWLTASVPDSSQLEHQLLQAAFYDCFYVLLPHPGLPSTLHIVLKLCPSPSLREDLMTHSSLSVTRT